MNQIQVQFKYNDTIRSATIDEPSTYEELEGLIKKNVPQITEFGLMHENHEGEHVFKLPYRHLLSFQVQT